MKRVLVALATFSLWASLVSTSYGAPIIDQAFPVGFPCPPGLIDCFFVGIRTNAVGANAVGAVLGQTFTVGLSGTLTGADLVAVNLDPSLPRVDFLVEVQSTSGGLPTSAVLTSGTIPAASVGTFFPSLLFQHVNFVTGVNVTAGEILALTFGPAAPGSDEGAAAILGPEEVTYAGGQTVRESFAGGPWIPFLPTLAPASDYAFRTYVDPLPVPVPEPGTVLLFGTGVFAALLRSIARKRREPHAAAEGPLQSTFDIFRIAI